MKVIFGKLGHDKGAHLTAGFMLCAVGLAVTSIVSAMFNLGWDYHYGLILAPIVGAAKEIYDLKKTGTAEILDFVATTIPAVLLLFIM